MNDFFSMDTGDEIQELGIINMIEEECPGVCFFSVGSGGQEFYAVSEKAAMISREAKSYGHPLASQPGLLVYPLYWEDDGGWKIIEYELLKYRSHGRGIHAEGTALLEAALEGMELHPAYFGAYPVPVETPWGYTLRHKAIGNGVYWLETDRLREAIAIYRGMCDDLSSIALSLAASGKAQEGMPETWGYLFFTREASCIPIFEMLPLHPEWVEKKLIDKAALKNAVCKNYPQYAIQYNLWEQKGQNSLETLLLEDFGAGGDRSVSVENMLVFSDSPNVEFLTFLG